MSRICLVISFLLLCAWGAEALELGKSPGAVHLTALEGHQRVLKNYAEQGGTLVVFLTSRDAGAPALVEALNALAGADANETLLTVGISVNPAESAEELKTFLQGQGAVFPVYRDATGKSARQFGAKQSGECFLLDPKGKLVYHGGAAGANAAVEDLLAKRTIATPTGEVAGPALDAPGTPAPVVNLHPPIHFASETLFDTIPGAVAFHCSTLAEAANGDLVCVWYGGSFESAEDQSLYIARRAKGGRDWTTPEVLIHTPDQPPGNAVVFRTPNDALCLVWGRMEGSRPTRRGSGWKKCRLMMRTSADNGHTWSADSEIPGSLGWLPRNPPVTVGGELYLPVSAVENGFEAGRLLRWDATKSAWEPRSFLRHAEQLSVAPRTDGSLLGLMRSQPHVLTSTTTDFGKTWTPVEATTLKCPDSAVCLLRLKSGRYLAAHNDNDGWDRAILTIHQSTDEGKTWTEPRVLEYEARLADGEYSYPCLIQTSDGMIHITYTCRRFTIKHAEFNEAWLTEVVRPN